MLDSRASRAGLLQFERDCAIKFINAWAVHPEAYYRLLMLNISLWEIDALGSITLGHQIVMDDRRKPSLADAADRASSAGDYTLRRHRLEREGRARP